jgi:hypothetical protein
MLTKFDYGRIKQAYEVTETIAGAARLAKVSRKAVAAARKRNFCFVPYSRRLSEKAAKRRKVAAKFAKMVCKKQHRRWPKYGTARKIQAAVEKACGQRVSVRQIQKDLHREQLRPYVRKALPTRSRTDFAKRKAFAENHRKLEWKKVVFSDESWLCCNERTGRTQWASSCKEVLALERKARWNVPSIMVWGSVGYNFRGPLIIFPSKKSEGGELRQFRLDAAGYVRRCLSAIVPLLDKGKRIFQQDGARSHAARSTMEYLSRKKVAVLADWPPYSPDLNAIERIWKELNARVGARCPLTTEELVEAALEEWERIPQSVINAHCAHLPRQLRQL